MPARVPLDIDLEDRLVYGLTPIRLGYAVLAGLAAMAVWSSGLIAPVRIPVVVLILLTGAALAWGKLRGRPTDDWLIDWLLFITSTRRFRWGRQ